MVKREITFKLDSRKFWSRPITSIMIIGIICYYYFFAEEACPTYHGKSCVRLWIPLQPTCRQLIKVEGPFSAVHPVVSAFPRTVARPALVNLPTTIPLLPVVTIMPKCQWWIRIIILSMVREFIKRLWKNKMFILENISWNDF